MCHNLCIKLDCFVNLGAYIVSSEESGADLQKEFVCALRELKSLADRDNLDEHKMYNAEKK